MSLNTIVAIVALAVALASLAGHVLVRLGRPAPWLGKLTAMQQRWGRPRGTIIHVVAYVVAPLLLAAVLLALEAGVLIPPD
jgi:hypothetical protein